MVILILFVILQLASLIAGGLYHETSELATSYAEENSKSDTLPSKL